MTTMKKRILTCILTAALLVPLTASAFNGAGDMNGDSRLNAFDLAIMKREFNTARDPYFDEPFPYDPDVNGNGGFTSYDVKQMQNFLLGKVSNFEEVAMTTGKPLAESDSPSENGKPADTKFRSVQMGFAENLFKETAQNEENTLISPLSVSIALSMTANGADAQTLKEMEDVLGMDMESMNEYMASFITDATGNANVSVNIANSIWFRDDENLKVSQEFLDTNSGYYASDAFAAPFDGGTVKDINNWVENETDGMIPELVDKLTPESMMVLINAIGFDAKWANPYAEYQVRDGIFTSVTGEKQEVEMLHGDGGKYFEFDNAVGISKAYAGYGYHFVAILPDEGMTVSEWITEMDSEEVLSSLNNPVKNYDILATTIPKFRYETSLKLAETLAAMGMPSAFDDITADFSNMATYTVNGTEYPLYISEVLHKTCIDLNETGTRAAAATSVEMAAGASANPVVREVILDRPFVYMIVDDENIPLFMGTVQSVE